MISFMSVIVLSQHFYNVLIFLELSVSSTNQCLLLILCELLLMFENLLPPQVFIQLHVQCYC